VYEELTKNMVLTVSSLQEEHEVNAQ